MHTHTHTHSLTHIASHILHSAQSNLTRLEQLEGDNTELATLVEEGRNQCQQLTEDIERLEQHVVELQQELTVVKAQTTTTESEYCQVSEENKALQAMLLQKGVS